MELDELYTLREAVDYLNRHQPAGQKAITERRLKYAVHETGRLAPIPVGSRDYGRNGEAYTIIFTRRMLDEYLRRMDQADAEPVRPGAADTTGWLESSAALAYVNERLRERGLEEMGADLFGHYRYQTDKLPSRTLGKVGIFLERDLDAFVAYLATLETVREEGIDRDKAAAYVTEQLQARGINRQVSPGTLNNYIYRDKILTGRKIGPLRVFDRDELDRLVAYIVEKEQEKRRKKEE